MATAAATRKLVLRMAMSLDGFVAGIGGEIDWVFKTSTSDSREWVIDTLHGAGLHIMGSGSYYTMAAFWPFADTPMAPAMNQTPKAIFSRRPLKDGTQAERPREGLLPSNSVLQSWAEPMVASGDLAEELLALKQQPGSYILAHGGARFARSLVAAGLIDEYRLAIHPVILGQGLPLFTALNKPADLRLVSATSFSGGIVGAIYQSG
ncbi:dihydrofolate reductase family protein [Dyella sp.]|uniref:dihydrofolate reductase family protein n=1 Tax=Dyella sp. TaxID=1869338 RepID=UPI002ED5AC1D